MALGAQLEYEIACCWFDFIVVMGQGNLMVAGYTGVIFEQVGLLEKIGLDMPWYEGVFGRG